MKQKNLKYYKKEAEELAQFAPRLSSVPKINPFRVDENYFEKLPVEILLKMHERNKVTYSSRLQNLLLNPKYSVPALTFVILILMVIFVFNKPGADTHNLMADLSFEDIMAENPDIITNMDETLLYETLFANNDEAYSGYFDGNIFNDASLSSEDLNEYLSTENLTPDLFNEY